ncbi:hypothetical protein PHMEG_0009861 [Phytophthora megakarya]|uniref:PH domain-containing protein n=1 Tax=Phytophthora megakarya TaxID=4795 RepID=A0A225WFF9_9STRA|nr:hypothetical protein PHMEG_0009861 [Phytophthora megakarya]
MCTIDSPMRSMRLEPSRVSVNSLGKYYADSPSPFTKPGDSYRRQQFQTHPLDSVPHPALTRKQGFLTALRVRNAVTLDGDGRGILDTIIPHIHRGRRLFYALVDSELREYADTVTLSNLAQTPCLHRYNLYNPRQICRVVDVPVTRGGAEALLRQSFLLIVDHSTHLFFTASSAIDKQTWMAELNHACVLGELQHPISVKVQSPRPVAAVPQPDPTSLAAVVIDAFKSRRKSTVEGRRSSICVPKPKPDDTLQVEYRISYL